MQLNELAFWYSEQMSFRMSQAPDEAAEFQRVFARIVKEANPNYERNTLARGVRLEYLREIAPGVFASHNVLCKKGTYYHGFAVTLHKELPAPYLLSPFTIGGRFDHNNSAKLAYFRDVEPNKKWPFGSLNFTDSHNFRKGWEAIAEKCTRIAEEKMLPHYHSKINKYKEPLLRLVQKAVSKGGFPITVELGRGNSFMIRNFDLDMPRFVESFNANISDSEAFLDEVIQAKPELFNRVLKMKSLNRAITTLAA